jgi:CHAT domain-containing protein/tetratricopeptide (TPR) repeat protein
MRVVAAFLAVTVQVAAALLAPPPAWAQAAPAASAKTAEQFESVFQRWLQIQDIEQKIAIGEPLLKVAQQLAPPQPQAVAELSFGLANAYVVRPLADRADNIERAIAHFETVLSLKTQQSDPPSWARAHNNLAIAFSARILGEKADNQERAIASFESAMAVLTRETEPKDWARLQNNLGSVYFSRIRGARASNIDLAIEAFEAALTVFTREDDRVEWAQLQTNLGSAYRSRVRGVRADNRELAIGHLEAALREIDRVRNAEVWATAQNNLAIAYLDRVKGDPSGNQEQSLAHLEEALTVFTRDSTPQKWATTQRVTGNLYVDRIKGSRSENQRRAIAAYSSALRVFTLTAFPLEHLSTSRSLASALQQNGKLRRAAEVYADARATFVLLFGEGLAEDSASALIADAGTLFPEAAYVAAARGQAQLALELANEGRGHLLSVALKLQTMRMPAAKRQRFDALQVAVRAQQQEVDETDGTDRAAALARLSELRRELLTIVKAANPPIAGRQTALAKAQALVAAGGAVVMPVITHSGSKLIVVTRARKGSGITIVDLPNLKVQNLVDLLTGVTGSPKSQGWLSAYFVNYLSDAERDRRWPEWLGAINDLGPTLWRLFGGELDATLKARGVAPGSRILWLPSGWLGIFPLGLSQNPDTLRRLADDYEIATGMTLDAFAPTADARVGTAPATLAAIINPTGDLTGTETEGALVASHFAAGGQSVLARGAATPEAVIDALRGKSYWHFASHGTFSWDTPRNSALIMAGQARLSVGRLLEASGLGRPRLVVLSACETGLNDVTSNPDEFVGLPGAFAALGARGVIGTLWPVSDAATALLMARFYELHMGSGLAPSAALREAQSWLRQATNEDLKAYARSASARGRLDGAQFAGIDRALTPEVLARSRGGGVVEWIARDETRGGKANAAPAARLARPYAHPYFWAGFVFTGL